jgi:hypothetical protein
MNIVCKNCDAHFKGKFCPQCAQKANSGRLKVVHVIEEFWHNFTHTDHSVLGLLKGMFSNPGLVIREFIEGKRKKYFNPYTFFLVATGILIFTTSKLFEYEDETLKVNNEFGQYISRHYNIIIICCFPFLALILKLGFYRLKYNYAEWVTFLVFAFGFINCIHILIQLLYFPLIKYHFTFNKYTQLLGYLVYVYVLISFVLPKKLPEIIGCVFCGLLVYFFVEKVGAGSALWYWGMPIEKVLKM